MFTTRRKGIIAILCAVFAAALIACAISLAPSATRTAPVYAAEGDLQVTKIVDTNNPSTTYATVEEAVAAGIKFIIDTDEPGVYNGYTSLYDTMRGGFKANDTLILLQDCETAYIQLPNGSTIDLNDHDLTYTGTSTIIFSGNSSRTATITDNSVSGSERGGTLNITGERDGSQSVFEIAGTTLNVSNINVQSTGCVFYPRGNTAELNITNCDITTTGVFCVSTNAGDPAYYGVTINISGSSLTAAAADYDDCAVMMNVSGSLNIENSVITGDRQGLFVRAGDVTVVDSEIVLTGNWAAQEANDDNKYHDEDWQSGNEAPSAAIVAGNRNGTYFADANVTIENSTITAPESVPAIPAIYADATNEPQGTAEESYSSDVSISGAETSVTGSIVNNATDGDGKSIEIAVTGGTFTADVAEYIPEGTILTQDKSGKIVEDENRVDSAVAEAGGVKYTTLQGAIDAAADGAVVTMLADTAEDITIAEGQDITLDLNGKTLTNESDHTITNSGTLTITDTVGGGTVDNITHARAAVYNAVGATANLIEGTYTRSAEIGTSVDDSGGNSFYVIQNFGTMVIGSENSTPTVCFPEDSGHFSSMIENGWYDGTTNTEQVNANLTINSGNFSGGINTIKNDDYGELEITGGTFTNVTQAAVLNWNVTKISGGTFEIDENASAVVLNGYLNDTMDKGQLTITDGTFIGGTIIEQMGGSTSIGSVAVSGGTFSEAFDSSYVAEGSVLYTTDGTNFTVGTDSEAIAADVKVIVDGVGYTKIPESVVATIGAEGEVPAGYETLQEAITAAADGDTITLVRNITTTSYTVINDKDITINLADFTITATGCDETYSSLLFIQGGSNVTIENGSLVGDFETSGINFDVIYLNSSNLTLNDVNISAAHDYMDGILFYGGMTNSDAVTAYSSKDFSNYYTLNVNNSTVVGYWYAIDGNAAGTHDGTIININNSTVTDATDVIGEPSGTAIFHPHFGILNVSGDDTLISGATGIEMRAGELNISGGNIVGNNEFMTSASGNGNSVFGAAVAVSQHTTNLLISVNVTGGTLETVGNAVYALYENDLMNDGDVDDITISVTGGTFNGEVYSEDVVDFISGGQFVVKPDDTYLAEGFSGFSEYNGMFVPVTSTTEGTMLEEIEQIRQEIDAAIAEVNEALAGSDAETLAESMTKLIDRMSELEAMIGELDESMVTSADLAALRGSVTAAYTAAVSQVRAQLSAQIDDLREAIAGMGDVSAELEELRAAYEAADELLSADIADVSAELEAAISELESAYGEADDAIWNAIYALRDADSGMTTALWVIGVIAVLALCAGVAGVAFAIVRTKRS